MEREKFYITTAIAYASRKPHIGNDYEIIFTDSIARFNRELGKDVFMLTGTDEHGQKIEELAKERGITPKEYADGISGVIRENYKHLNISNDGFIRTTDKHHEETVQKIFKKLFEQGDIYKSSYEGLYCTPCESFWTETQLVDGCCPDCGRPVSKTNEEAYFFKMSKYQDRLIEYIELHPDFILPEQRKREMINNFLKPGLLDLCVSRTSFKWGVPVDFDEKHVIYVWIDALANYITAIGYDIDNSSEQFKKYWPCDLHVIGKDILRFHTIYWPIILMALGVPLPKTVFGHPWLLFANDKMSKSKGNVLYSDELSKDFTVDGVRYYVLSQMPYDRDGNITLEMLISTYNSDLANTLGNLVNRTIVMANKYFDGKLTAPNYSAPVHEKFASDIDALKLKVQKLMTEYRASDALFEIMQNARLSNKYIDDTMPWVLGKDESKKDELNAVLYNLLESIRVIAILMRSFTPATSENILGQIGADKTDYNSANYKKDVRFALSHSPSPIFARIDEKKYIEEHNKKMEDIKKVEAKPEVKPEAKEEKVSEITIDDFAKVQLKVAKVLTAEKVEKSDKLLKMTVSLGSETRQVVSGIAKHYTPEDMVGRKVVFVANLKPAKLRGIMSEGMILCASTSDDSKVILVSPSADIEEGSDIF